MSARKQFTKKEISKFVSAYKKGATLRDLATEGECSVTTMRTLLTDNGVTMRARGRVAAPAPKGKKAAAATKATKSKTVPAAKTKASAKAKAKK